MIVEDGLGIQEELIDEVFPTLYPQKETWERMKELVKQGDNNEEICRKLNEHYEERLFNKGSNAV